MGMLDNFNPIGSLLDIGTHLIDWNQRKKQAEGQMNMEEEFAKNGISWKIADAARMGISPLAALGAQGTNYSPITIGDPGFSQVGQDLSRSLMATRDRPTRDMLLANKLTESQIHKTEAEADYWASKAREVQPPHVGPGIPTPDAQDFISDSGEMYRGPSDAWSMTHPGALSAMGWAIRNNLLPFIKEFGSPGVPGFVKQFQYRKFIKKGTRR